MKKVIYLLLAVCMILSIGTVVWGVINIPQAVAIDSVESISLSSSSISLKIYENGNHDTTLLRATPKITGGESATGRTISWSSSNSSVATVSSLGRVTAVGNGVCYITATCEGKSARCRVSVVMSGSGTETGDDPTDDSGVKPTGIRLSTNVLPNIVGKGSASLTATLIPSDATGEIEWSTSSPDKIMVNGSNTSATIIAMGPGLALITATVKGTNISAGCRVTVQMCSAAGNILDHTTVNKGYSYTETEHTQLQGCDECGITWKYKTAKHNFKAGRCLDCGYSKDNANNPTPINADPEYSTGTKCGPNYRVDGHYPDYYTDLYKYTSTTSHEAYLKCSKCGTQWLVLTESHTYSYNNNTICRCGYGKDGGMHDLNSGHQIVPDNANSNSNSVYPNKIEINEKDVTIDTGKTIKLTATLGWSATDWNKSNKKEKISWSSRNTSVAKVDSSGTVTGIRVGKATITATTENGLKATCVVEVTNQGQAIYPINIAIIEKDVNVELEKTVKLTAYLEWNSADSLETNKNDKITWNSGNTSVAQVDTNGTVTGLKAGKTTITATTENGLKATCEVEVTDIMSSTVTKYLVCLDTYQLEYGEPGVVWKTKSNPHPTYTTVNESGFVQVLGDYPTVKSYNVVVEGWLNDKVVKTYTLNIGRDTVTPTTLKLHVGETYQLNPPKNAKGLSLSWTVNAAGGGVVSVDNGKVTAIAPGTAKVGLNNIPLGSNQMITEDCIITVEDAKEVNDGRTFTITPSSYKLAAKETKQLSFKCTSGEIKSDEKLTWSSSNTNVATVDSSSGLVTAKAAGTTTISAKLNDIVATTCTIEIVADYKQLYTWPTASPIILEVNNIDSNGKSINNTKQIKINGLRDGDKIDWSSAGESATVSQDGLVTAVKASSAVTSVTAKINGKIINTWTVKVSEYQPFSIEVPSSITIGKGATTTLTANVKSANGSISWSTGDSTYIDLKQGDGQNSCTITGKEVGKATVTATYAENGNTKQATCAVTVSDTVLNSSGDNIKLTINAPGASTVKEGNTIQLRASATSGDKTILVTKLGTLVWKSQDSVAASVTPDGKITFLRGGRSAVVSVETMSAIDGKKVTAKITIPIKHTSEQIIEYNRGTEGSQFDRTMHYVRVYCPNCGYYVIEEEHKYESNGYCKCGKAKPSSGGNGGSNGGSNEPLCTKLQPSGDNSIFKIGDKIELIDYIKFESENAVFEMEYSIPNGGLDSTLSVKLEKDEFGTLKFLSGYGKIKVKIKDKRSSLETELHFEVLKVEENAKPVEEKKFDDVNTNDWFYEDVMASFGDGIFNGVSNTEFSPNGTITRGMFITGLYRLDMTDEKIFNIFFNDVEDGMYYTEPITWATEHAIASGITNQEFQPNENITRAHMAKYIANYLRIRHPGLVEGATKIQVEDFSDKEDLPDWSVDAIKMLQELGLINGKGNNEYKPNDTLTRAEASTILNRVSNFVYTREGEHSPLRVK